jgi:hypothetical protein
VWQGGFTNMNPAMRNLQYRVSWTRSKLAVEAAAL